MAETESLEKWKLFTERIYKELQTVQEFRFKFTITKITFVSGLLGIGALKLTTSNVTVDLSPTLWLAPLIAVLFDIFGMTATVAIYRIDAFLRNNVVLSEQKWQKFLKNNPLSLFPPACKEPSQPECKKRQGCSFHRAASDGFTGVTFLASLLLYLCVKPNNAPCWVVTAIFMMMWFALIIAGWFWFRQREQKLKDYFEHLGT